MVENPIRLMHTLPYDERQILAMMDAALLFALVPEGADRAPASAASRATIDLANYSNWEEKDKKDSYKMMSERSRNQ